jgi:hypothetical protein
MTTRKGKIARLPRALREELNRRILEGAPGVRLVEWLNAQNGVRDVLVAEFEGRPVNEQNLTEWKQGGYEEWLTHREMIERVRDFTGEAAGLAAAGGSLAEHLAGVLTARYALAFHDWDGDPESPLARRLRVLSAVCQDLVALRRGEHSAGRLRLEQARLALVNKEVDEMMEKEFEQWCQLPKNRKRIFKYDRSAAEEMARQIRVGFGDILKAWPMPPLPEDFTGQEGEGI